MAKHRNNPQFGRDSDPLQEAKDHFGANYDKLLRLEKLDEGLDSVLDDLQKFVEINCSGVTTSQLRNIFNRMPKQVQAADLKRLRPNLMYVIARQKKSIKAQRIMYLVEDLIKKADESSASSVRKVMEAIVAYHKFYYDPQNEKQ